MKKSIKIILVFLCLGAVVSPAPALAHRVILFAWVEDGQVHVEGGFGSDKPAQNCEILAFDKDKELVFSGKTDTTGRLSFKVPEGYASDLIIELNAGPGHKGRWTIQTEEFIAAVPLAAPANATEHQALKKGADPLRILVGIGVIFALALGVNLLRKKAKASCPAKGFSND